ncbi:cyclopropane-fatty-acyl-phospholipid synthase family protein [Iodobacter sp. CM08]|uniref:cyclopropane-fatty-acyl-phospholipid synthase family protein n=1 Tax=Iodobacter sp. CM08 TaxID=3085902 RepID=UPI002981FF67|nr:cyclopropane-fatty-acyl-phospholipid synthase family protein [Iodobacter sp. CM08]MDW5416461.1 cyclopropane-fatty-acyl-phospholipid synthase family protein [Iodobacter sp. CM08]
MSQSQALQTISRSAPTAAKLFLNLLARLQHGHLQLITPEGTHLMFGDLHQPPSATLQIHDWRACQRILRAGDIGFAESYEAGWIDSADLTALLRLAIRNQNVLDKMVFGGKLATLWYRLKHLFRRNTREGSRKNIHAHYDIGNAFYQLWLDPTWTYSSAMFHGDYAQSLQQAQLNKYQRIIDTLALSAGSRVLEIGCGWGGFAAYAARQGIDVHGVTISAAQLAIAQERITRQGLNSLVQLELCDYRDLTGQYDAIVSIEMFEAVGEAFWPEYFKTVAARLKVGGQALVQSITIDENAFERYRSGTDFIQQYIFPGGMLPSPERFVAKAQSAGLKTTDQYHFGGDYAETLRRWKVACRNEAAAIADQGFDERFMRIWMLYFAYCEAGFDEGKTDVVQFLLHKDH